MTATRPTNRSKLTPTVDRKIEKVLDKLPGISRNVIELTFGLDGGHPTSRADIATRLGLSTTEVADIEQRAIARLRELVPDQQLTAILARL